MVRLELFQEQDWVWYFSFGQGIFFNKVEKRTGRRSRQDKTYVRNLADDFLPFLANVLTVLKHMVIVVEKYLEVVQKAYAYRTITFSVTYKQFTLHSLK